MSDESEPELRGRDDGRTRRGRRLEANEQPSAEDREYARSRGFTEAEIDDMAANFRCYWTKGPGRNRTHAQWWHANGAWGTWVRKESPRRGCGAGQHDAGGSRQGRGSVVAAASRALDLLAMEDASD